MGELHASVHGAGPEKEVTDGLFPEGGGARSSPLSSSAGEKERDNNNDLSGGNGVYHAHVHNCSPFVLYIPFPGHTVHGTRN